MKYDDVVSAIFLSRPNRFIAECKVNGKIELCHVKNTGRCKELLIPGTKVFVQKANNPNRKTKYSLITVKKQNRLINIDSQIPNKVFEEWIKGGELGKPKNIKSEVTYGNSRLDFYAEINGKKTFIEVKGVTLEEDGVAMFPDAPTKRGVKHLLELSKCMDQGYEAMIVFIIQMQGVRYFTPNDKTHAEFGDTLRKAQKLGVQLLALDCKVEPDKISAISKVEIKL